MPQISLIVASSENGAIGKDGKLPWHLPNDLKRFKALTLGKPIIMGRKTFDSIGKALPGRKNIVLTRQNNELPGCEIADTPEHALALCKNADEVMIIGGDAIYRLFLDRCDVVYLTHVHTTLDGDAFFAPLDASEWQLTEQEDHSADERHAFAYSFLTYKRSL